MKAIKTASAVNFPSGADGDMFRFNAAHKDGIFTFLFKWLNNRWNCWGATPSGEIRQIGVYPNVISWSGFPDYGIMIATDLSEIGRQSLTLTEIHILTWE